MKDDDHKLRIRTMRNHMKEDVARYRKLYPNDERDDIEIWDAIERVREEPRYHYFHILRQVSEGDWSEAELKKGHPLTEIGDIE